MSYAEQIGTYHLADNPGAYEPQRSNNFEFVVTGLNGILRAGANGTEEFATIPEAEDILRISVVGAPVPHFSQDIITIKRGNSTMKFPGVPTFDQGTVTLNDFINQLPGGASTKDVLMAWQNLSYNVKTEKVGNLYYSKYKKDCTLIEYTPDYRKVRSWILHGCWISGVSEEGYSNENGGKRNITATIQYDWGEPDTSELV